MRVKLTSGLSSNEATFKPGDVIETDEGERLIAAGVAVPAQGKAVTATPKASKPETTEPETASAAPPENAARATGRNKPRG